VAQPAAAASAISFGNGSALPNISSFAADGGVSSDEDGHSDSDSDESVSAASGRSSSMFAFREKDLKTINSIIRTRVASAQAHGGVASASNAPVVMRAIYGMPGTGTPIPWGITTLSNVRTSDGIFPFRRQDIASKDLRGFRCDLASCSYVSIHQFDRSLIDLSGNINQLAQRVSRRRQQSANAPNSSASSTTAVPSSVTTNANGTVIRFAQWFDRFMLYTDAMTYLYPHLRDGMLEYARFIGTLSAIGSSFSDIIAHDEDWRIQIHMQGIPINQYNHIIEHFRRLINPAVMDLYPRRSNTQSDSGNRPTPAPRAPRQPWQQHPPQQATTPFNPSHANEICRKWNEGTCTANDSIVGTDRHRRHVCSSCQSRDHKAPQCTSRPTGAQGAPPASSNSSAPHNRG
jgi:hypothetical protein